MTQRRIRTVVAGSAEAAARSQDSRGSISPSDRGFLLADGLFETMRIYNGRPFRLQQHLDRLRRSAEHMGIPVPPSIEAEIASVVAESAALWSTDARLRVTLSRGESQQPGLDFNSDGEVRPTLVLSADPIETGGRNADERGGRGTSVVIAASRRNELSATAGHKTVSFTDAILEVKRARALGADDCIFLDTMGHVSEASASNVFLFDGESLLVPPISCGVLPGITRAVVLEIAATMALRVEERAIEREELLLAREVFLTSSVKEVVPVFRIEGNRVGSGGVGEVSGEIGRRYGVEVGRFTDK